MKQLLINMERTFNLKEIKLDELHNFFPEYKKGATLYEITEGYIRSAETIKFYIRNASSENNYLPEELRQYDLYILCFKNQKLISTFYREQFGENRQIIDYIEALKIK